MASCYELSSECQTKGDDIKSNVQLTSLDTLVAKKRGEIKAHFYHAFLDTLVAKKRDWIRANV
jgi:hypothetical protein